MTVKQTLIAGFLPVHFGWRLCEADGARLVFVPDVSRACGEDWHKSPASDSWVTTSTPWYPNMQPLLKVATLGLNCPDPNPRQFMSQDDLVARGEIAREASGNRYIRYGMTLADVVAVLASGAPDASVCLPALLLEHDPGGAS